MRKIGGLLALLLTGLVVILVSCEEEEEPVQPFTQGMRAKVEGVDWLASECRVQLSDVPYYGEMLSVIGMSQDQKLIVIDVEYHGEGLYEFDTRNVGSYTPDQDGSLTYTSHALPQGSGSLFVSEINLVDSVVSGTFEFNAYCAANENSVIVLDGEFINIPLKAEVEEYLPEDNYFTVNVDSVPWTPQTIWGSSSSMTNTISVSSTSSLTSESIGLSLNDDVIEGTYDLHLITFPTALYNVDDSTYTSLSSGSVTITEHDTEHNWIEGTFYFTSTYESNTYNLTNGTFGVNY